MEKKIAIIVIICCNMIHAHCNMTHAQNINFFIIEEKGNIGRSIPLQLI